MKRAYGETDRQTDRKRERVRQRVRDADTVSMSSVRDQQSIEIGSRTRKFKSLYNFFKYSTGLIKHNFVSSFLLL